MQTKKRVLIGSPIKQVPEVLKLFLTSLKNLEKDSMILDFYFIDDNDNLQSMEALSSFAAEYPQSTLIGQGEKAAVQLRGEDTHHWRENMVWRVAEYKNRVIRQGLDMEYDYVFFIDSDLILHPKTLKHLISTDKDIVSEIFWTKWTPSSVPLPQVWLYDHYSMVRKGRLEPVSGEEANKRYEAFLEQLRKPGVYEIGGLGACTLISRNALIKGVSFDEIYNVSFWGEDRHFCIRAAALGLRLFVDTTYPAYHIYRSEDIAGVKEYLIQCNESIREGL